MRPVQIDCPLRCLAAAVCGLLIVGAGTALAAEPQRAGVSGAVRGDVALTSVLTRTTQPTRSGDAVYLGDSVRTGADSGLQILLLDESVFTLGEEAEVTIDRYIYDPDRGVAGLSASLVRGGLRFVSGRISETAPDEVELRLPTATIGVRGTIVTAVQAEEGAYVFLDGPAPDNDAFQREGLVEVTAGGRTVALTRPGFATFVPPGGVPQVPFRPDPALRAQVQAGVAAPAASGNATVQGAQASAAAAVDNPAAAAGAARMAALGVARGAERRASARLARSPSEADDRTILEAAPLEASVTDVAALTSDITGFAEIASLAQLDSLGGGIGHFRGTGSFFQIERNGAALETPIAGTLEISAQIDFGARTIFGGDSAVRAVAGSISYVDAIETESFSEGIGGLAVFGDLSSGGDDPSDGVLFIQNGEGIADRASGVVRFDDGSDVGVGSVVDMPRQPGPAPSLSGGS
jgi:hypothetical protein